MKRLSIALLTFSMLSTPVLAQGYPGQPTWGGGNHPDYNADHSRHDRSEHHEMEHHAMEHHKEHHKEHHHMDKHEHHNDDHHADDHATHQ